jgi:glycosyltransferase involved in cell wall biosynthesis
VATWWAAVRGGEPLPEDFVWRTRLVGEGLHAADAVVTPSRALAEATAAAYSLSDVPLVVHNGRSRHTAPVPIDKPGVFAFTAGRLWDEGKDIATLDRAADRIAVRVVAAGPLVGPNGARADLHDVEHIGELSSAEVRARLAARPIFVSTSLYEPFGLAVLEAAEAGCPLVLTDIPTFRELWDGAALFVSTRGDAALANAIERLAADRGLRKSMGEAARGRACRYSVEAMVDGMIGIYRKAVAKPGASVRRAAA